MGVKPATTAIPLRAMAARHALSKTLGAVLRTPLYRDDRRVTAAETGSSVGASNATTPIRLRATGAPSLVKPRPLLPARHREEPAPTAATGSSSKERFVMQAPQTALVACRIARQSQPISTAAYLGLRATNVVTARSTQANLATTRP